ncbi:MAG: Membrane protein-like protein [Candidatus Magasanikbacteria bacterium GW2011_GWA2_46_17]|uniref:Membrane protein-like protein n=1 Tax=Candidatus Magasanikbacteria bacterium GW2011_GWA2_46_17 TaxID=1619042 RepID=A0A0G1P1C1_9BACT|nr:MAG: Membrane protein-like protein [Candidatus Magasanikbacteria bacterium GW2011_GWA2_46_17]
MLRIIKSNSALILVLVLATTLRLVALLKYGDFWNDEMFSFVYSQKPWWDSITKYWVWETNPPLYTLLLKLWLYIMPPTEFWIRLMSILPGLLGIAALHRLAIRLFNKNTALISALVLAVSPLHILHSSTARAYSLLVLLTIVSSDYFYRIYFENKRSMANYLIYGSLITLLFYSHLTSLAVIGAQFAALIIRDRRQISSWLIVNILPFIIWLFWAVPSLSMKLNSSLVGAWYFKIKTDFSSTIQMVQLLFTGPTHWIYGLIVIVLVVAWLAFILIRQYREKRLDQALIFVVIMAGVPLLGALTLGLTNPRFLMVSVPWTALLLAFALTSFIKKFSFQMLGLAIFIPGLIGLWRALPIVNLTPAREFLQARASHQNRQIFIYNEFTSKNMLERYLKLNIPMISFTEEQITDWDYYYITKNYSRRNFTKEEIGAWSRDNKLDTYDEIFLLQNNDPGLDIKEALEYQGWKIREKKKIKVEEPIVLFYLSKDK